MEFHSVFVKWSFHSARSFVIVWKHSPSWKIRVIRVHSFPFALTRTPLVSVVDSIGNRSSSYLGRSLRNGILCPSITNRSYYAAAISLLNPVALAFTLTSHEPFS